MVGQTVPLPHDRKSARSPHADLGRSLYRRTEERSEAVSALSRIHTSEETCASAQLVRRWAGVAVSGSDQLAGGVTK
jgi:hypothetical protein